MKRWERIIWTALAVLFIVCLAFLYQSTKQCEAAFGADSIYCQD